MDIITKNPGLQHISEEIFMNLDSECLMNCQEVNSYWKELIKNPKFWLKKCNSNTSSFQLTKKSQMEWKTAIQALKNKRDKSTLASYLIKMHDKAELVGYSPLQIAARKGNKSILKILAPLMTDGLDEPYPNGRTPLEEASYKGKIEIIKILAPLMVNPNSPDKNGWTPIQKAARLEYEKHNAEIVKLLAPLTNSPNGSDPSGWTPIQNAAYHIYYRTDADDKAVYKIIIV